MTKKTIVSRSNDENLITWLNTKENQSQFIEDILNKVRKGELVEPKSLEAKKQLDLAIKSASLQNKIIDIEIKEQKLKYFKTFNSELSHSASNAIKKGVETRSLNEIEEKTLMSHFGEVQTLIGEVGTQCNHCEAIVFGSTHEILVRECTRHLTVLHKKEVMNIDSD